NRTTENLFSAFIEKLFDDPIDAAPSWPALHFVLRDPSRNILFNHLGLGEDEMKMILRPDCADLPYFLRAYFAFKMGLPYGFSKCTRGGGRTAPPPRQRACRLAAHGARRQQPRLRSGGADAGDFAARHGLRRSVRPHPDDRAPRGADRELGRRDPRGRRPARRHGGAQALLA